MSNFAHAFEVFLLPGEWCVGDEQLRVRTLLGSCVSISLWHPELRIGGMCHFMLAKRKNLQSPGVLSGRYADEAILLLLHGLLKSGMSVSEFHAKMVGGASVFSSLAQEMRQATVPAENIEAARCLGRQFGLNVQAEDLGGHGARQVVFDVATGDMWVRQKSGYDVVAEHGLKQKGR